MLGRHLSNRRDLGQVSYFGLKGNVDAEDRQTLRTLEQIEAALVARGGHAPRKDYARGIHWSGNQAGSSPPSLLLPLPMSLLYTHSLPPYCGRTPGSPAARGSPDTALPPQTVPRRARQVRLPRRRRRT